MCVRLLTESKLDFEIRYRLRVLHVRGACSVRHPSAVRRQPLGRLRFDQGNSRGSRGAQPRSHHCWCAHLCLLGYLTNRPFVTEIHSPGDTVHLPSYCSLTVIVSSHLHQNFCSNVPSSCSRFTSLHGPSLITQLYNTLTYPPSLPNQYREYKSVNNNLKTPVSAVCVVGISNSSKI